MVVLIVGVSAAVAIVQHWDYLFPTKLGRQTQYAGLKLGMSPKEVMYIKGFPSTVLGEESTDPTMKGWFLVINTKELEKGKEVTDYANWSYNYDKHNLNVEFDGARTAVIAIQCYSEDKLTRCPSIGDVTDGAKEGRASQARQPRRGGYRRRD
jgi:hypothetical protein